MEHEMHTLIKVDLTTAVSHGDKRTYSPPRLIPLATIDVKTGATSYIAEGTGGGLLNTHS
jgi:hypothetical protein